MISLSAINTEEEERLFADINAISKSTSSGRPNHIIPNSILRLQAEKHFKDLREDCTEAQESQISHFAHQLPKAANTSFFGDLFQSEMYQAHLERISDYLLPGEGVWWHRDEESCSIVFHDSVDEDDWRDEGPAMCHFRSSSLKSIELRVQSSWEKCLADMAEHIRMGAG